MKSPDPSDRPSAFTDSSLEGTCSPSSAASAASDSDDAPPSLTGSQMRLYAAELNRLTNQNNPNYFPDLLPSLFLQFDQLQLPAPITSRNSKQYRLFSQQHMRWRQFGVSLRGAYYCWYFSRALFAWLWLAAVPLLWFHPQLNWLYPLQATVAIFCAMLVFQPNPWATRSPPVWRINLALAGCWVKFYLEHVLLWRTGLWFHLHFGTEITFYDVYNFFVFICCMLNLSMSLRGITFVMYEMNLQSVLQDEANAEHFVRSTSCFQFGEEEEEEEDGEWPVWARHMMVDRISVHVTRMAVAECLAA